MTMNFDSLTPDLRTVAAQLESLRKSRDAEMVRLYTQENLSLLEIGDIYAVRATTVGRTLMRNGITLRPRGRPRKQLDLPLPAPIEAAV